MGSRYATEKELLNFFTSNGYIAVEDVYGSRAIVCRPENKETLIGGITINYTHDEIQSGYLEETLKRGGFTVEEFWKQMGY